jgi:hypothetical protein
MSTILDYKKEHKDLYSPKNQPALIEVPEIAFVAVEGKGDPHKNDGEYQKALEILYGISYTIKMSKKGEYMPPGYFDFVVPPLEGLWWTEKEEDVHVKSKYTWISMIRLPEYVSKEIFDWAVTAVAKKKKIDTGKAKYFSFAEGLCVQCMHTGPFDDEPETMKLIDVFINENGLMKDLNENRRHHEIYLSDPRKGDVAKMKTVLRIPVRTV